VEHQGERLGALRITSSPRGPLTPAGERLVKDVAAQAGLVLRNVALIEDLRASRQRLAAASDEARRRLERNLHDGAQQQLVALRITLQLARQHGGRLTGRGGRAARSDRAGGAGRAGRAP
jgi:signal transduction histidine kinase